MNSSNLLQPLQDILQQAYALMELVQAQDWQAFESQSVSYHEQIAFLNDEAYLQALTNADLAIPARELVAQIQVLNNELDMQASHTREKIASELRQIMQANKAINAYGR